MCAACFAAAGEIIWATFFGSTKNIRALLFGNTRGEILSTFWRAEKVVKNIFGVHFRWSFRAARFRFKIVGPRQVQYKSLDM